MSGAEWFRQKAGFEFISAEQARKERAERESAFVAERQRCRCKEPQIIRKYLGAGLCVACSLPHYS